jgi:phi13 family phage major tail protein
MEAFYADGIKYYVTSSNGGYEGDVELALIPDSFRKDILKETEDDNHVLIERADVNPIEFACGFDIDTDTITTRLWFYNCTAARPQVEAETNEDKKTPKTDKIKISCVADASGKIRAKTTEETPEAVRDAWFTEVYPATNPVIAVTPKEVTVETGDTAEVAVSYAGFTPSTITATSSEENKATAEYANGVVTITGVAAGSATITVNGTQGTKTASATIAVTVVTPGV